MRRQRRRLWSRRPLRLEALESRRLLSVFSVDNTGDSGDGSLRWAIGAANTNPGPDTIEFAVAGTIHVETPLSFRSVVAYGTAGNGDVAMLYDMPGAKDRLKATPEYGLLYNDTFFNKALGFDAVYAEAYWSDADVALLYDSAAPDVFEATPDEGVLKYAGQEDHFVQARGFRYLHGLATTENGGLDVAYLADSAATQDRFVGMPDDSRLYGPDFYLRAKWFEQVTAVAGAAAAGGLGAAQVDSDVALLYDSIGSDTFEGTPDYGRLKYDGSEEHFVEAIGFRYVHAIALAVDTPGSVDRTVLYDSILDDILVATPQYTKLYNATFSNRATYFDEVTAWASQRASKDKVYFYDSPWDDHLEAVGNLAELTTPEQVTRAYDFTWVRATCSAGGTDTKHEEAHEYLLETVGPWIDI